VIADPASVVLTAHVANWADDDRTRLVWILECLDRQNHRDWGDLDVDDAATNDRALRNGAGRLLSRYPLPVALGGDGDADDAVWIITDDIADPDSVTTVLWPSDY